MTIKRNRDGIVFVCDDCGEEHPSFTRDWSDALDDFKADGGRAQLVDGDWHHYCKGCGE